MGGYVYMRAIAPTGWSKKSKSAAAVGLGLVAGRLLILTWLSEVSPYAPDMPAWLNHLYSWLFIALLIWFCSIFAGHVVRQIVLRHIPKWRSLAPSRQQKAYHQLHLAWLGVALIVSGIGTYGGLKEPGIREISIPCSGMKAPLRIALLSDLHVSALKDEKMLRRIVERTNGLGADIVAIVGDIVDGSVEQCGARMHALRELKAPQGVYGVAGNHDYYSGYEIWRARLNELGVRMLDNAHELLPNGQAVVAGVTEETAGMMPGMEVPSVSKALQGAPEGVPVILLSHRPNIVREAARHGVGIQLSGHTHGGLVWGIGQLVAAMNDGYLSGVYREGQTQLYVSPGTSSGGRTPLRMGVPAEITLITLTPQAPPGPDKVEAQ